MKKLFPPRRTIVGILVLGLVCWIAPGFQKFRESDQMLDARAIGLMLFQYAADHNDEYPTGKTSTEVFQQLIDGGYVSDGENAESPRKGAAIFYEMFPGKTPAKSHKLRPENVAWDLIVPVKRMPEDMPILLTTGYRLDLKPNGGATPRTWPPRSWGDWLENIDYPRGYLVFVRNPGTFLRQAGPDGSIPNLVPGDFDPAEPYRQLTPDGSTP